MKILLNTLPKGKSEEIFDTLEPLINAEGMDWEPLELILKLEINNQNPNYYLHGDINTKGRFICSKGLESFEDTLKSDFDVLVTFDEKEFSIDNDDVFLMQTGEVIFDLDNLLRETIFTSRPIAHCCEENCPEFEKLIALVGAEQDIDDRWLNLRNMFKEETN
mgnify:FL=1|jgi:uncharacterized metal-binding protein YceD (DUF177 family)